VAAQLGRESIPATSDEPAIGAPRVSAPPLKHRPDIDGLRAVAVLVVVLYHLGLPVRGGFVGVDVFFVISGFLISSIILTQLHAGTFAFANFYERRVRRILPALFVMLVATGALAYRYLLPVELKDYARSLISADLSVSNVYFWLKSGYFDEGATSKPLLHTWSLAVEEQFYVFLPIVLWLLKRRAPKRLGSSLVFFAAVSFALSVVGAYLYPTATFYLAPTRAWELLLGTLMSLEGFPRLRQRITRELAGLAGIGLILGSSLLYRTATVFPGLAALVPCAGAVLVIAAGRDGECWIGRALSLRPVVFVGLISYSLYLWHWPIIVFSSFGMTLISGLARRESQLLVFCASLIAATLSWQFVERPFRVGGGVKMSRSSIFRWAASLVATMAIVGSTGILSHGLPARFPVEAQKVADYMDQGRAHDQFRTDTCFMTARDWKLDTFDLHECMPTEAGKGTLLVLGDSHAAHLWWGLRSVYGDRWNVMQATAAGCKPVLQQRPRQFPGCTRLMSFIFNEYLPAHPVDTLLIEARWDPDDMPGLAQTLEQLRKRGVPVVLFGPMLQYDAPLPRLLAMSIRQNDPSLPSAHRVAAMSSLDARMAESARSEWRFPYVSMIDLLCKSDRCVEYAGPDIPLLLDYGHLTKAGSVFVAEKLRDAGKLSY
jgi:peptidoglycan/LPS O-acetylase OafA/YrhL